MKPKDIEKVKETMMAEEIEPDKINKVVGHLANEPDAGRKNQTVKKQWVFVLSDPTGRLSPQFFESAGFDSFVGWPVQIAEGESIESTMKNVHAALYDFNASPKGRRMPVETIGEGCEAVAARFFKAHNVWAKSKEPIPVVITDNKLPRG